MERKIVIYGAGERGRHFYDFLKSKRLNDIVYGFCDRNYRRICQVEDKVVHDYEEIKDMGFHYVVSLVNEVERDKICKKIIDDGNTAGTFDSAAELCGEDKVSFNRELCAFFHKGSMNDYFEKAETAEHLAIFWDSSSPFYQNFSKLNLTNVIELACGRGRHVPQYISGANQVTLVDILPENIAFCKQRFRKYENISYYCNNGYNLEKLESDSYSSLFCYDAMVHFELMDIYEYLKDIYRVLQKGGYALIHHSNNGNDFKAAFASAYNGRSFMTKEVFAYLAYRAGFEIVSQQVIDWQIKNIDCISLIRKN